MTRRFTVLAKPCSPDVLMNAMRDAIRSATHQERLRLHNSRIKKPDLVRSGSKAPPKEETEGAWI